MTGTWRGRFATVQVPVEGSLIFDLNPYRHWLTRPRKTEPDLIEGCPEPPVPAVAPFVFVLNVPGGFAGASVNDRAEMLRRFGETFNFLKLAPFYSTLWKSGFVPDMPFYATGFLDSLLTADFVEWSSQSELLRIVATGAPLPARLKVRNIARSEPPPAPSVLPLPFPAKIVAVVDTDIPFAHARFRKSATETRIAYFWDMDADLDEQANMAPSHVPIGRELYRTDIDGYLARLAAGEFGESGLYAAYQTDIYSDPTLASPPSISAHGAHILDMVAGADYQTDHAAMDVAIFAVQLPRAAIAGTHGGFLFPYVQMAIDRVRERVIAFTAAHNDANGTSLPHPKIYLNLSLGGVAGRHDGLSQFERYLDALIDAGQVETVNIAGGNVRGQALHARFSKEGVESGASIDWRIQPDDGTVSFLQTWLPEGADPGHLEFELAPPGGHPAITLMGGNGDIVPGKYYELSDGCEVLGRVYVETDAWPVPPNVLPENPRTVITVAVRHTKSFHNSHGYEGGLADLAGIWKLRLKAANTLLLKDGEEIMLWVERDDPLGTGKTGARQSSLENPDGGAVSDEGTLNDIATGKSTCVVAAYRRSDGAIADYSSFGFYFLANGQSKSALPTVAVAADDSPILKGLLGAGYFSGSARRLSGTSVGVALLTRHTAGLGNVTAPATPVRASLQDQAQADESDALAAALDLRPQPKATEAGAGRLLRLQPIKPMP